jgi:WD40 repeat protein
MMTLSIMMKTNHRSCRLDEWFIVPYLGSVGWRGSESGRNRAKRGSQRGLQKWMQHVRRGRQGAVRFSADGQKIVSSSGQIDGDDNTVRIWSAVTGKREQTMKGHRVKKKKKT